MNNNLVLFKFLKYIMLVLNNIQLCNYSFVRPITQYKC